MVDLSYYLEAWNLVEAELLAETATSTVYTVIYNHEKVALKLLTPIGEDDEKSGATALKYFNGNGAVKLLKHNSKAQLLEFADGDHLSTLVKSNDDEKATIIIAEILNKLHHSYSGQTPCDLTQLSDRFFSLFNKANKDGTTELDLIFIRGAKVANNLLNSPTDSHILHGDIHHGNILQSQKRGWLSIDPKGIVGERTYDAANTLCNPWDMPDLVENEKRLLENANILAEITKIDIQRLLGFTFAHACLSASWLLEDGGDPTHPLNMAKFLEPLLDNY